MAKNAVPAMHGSMATHFDGSTIDGNPRLIKVLMYHRLTDDAELSRTNWTCVHVDDFRNQLRLLNDWGFSTITFDDFRLFRSGAINLPRRPIILTFDDGYLDTYELAFPVMQDLGMKSVVFVLGDRTIRTNYWDRHLGMSETRLMTREQMLEMSRAGHEIGAHSTTHAKLSRVPEDRAWEEISRSKILLEMALGAPVQSFCYPYGMLNPHVKRMVERSGYDIACSVDTGPASFGDDLLEIRRMTIFNTTSTLVFGMRMLTPFEYFDWTRWKLVHTLNEFQGKNVMPPSKKIAQFHPIGIK